MHGAAPPLNPLKAFHYINLLQVGATPALSQHPWQGARRVVRHVFQVELLRLNTTGPVSKPKWDFTLTFYTLTGEYSPL